MKNESGAGDITIKALFFGACREAAADEVSLTLKAGSNVADAFDALKKRYPKLEPFTGRLLFAVNETYSPSDQVLEAGDALAILPPVSGGSQGEDVYELTRSDIDSRKLALRVLQPADGAIVTFDGVTRNNSNGRPVLYLAYEAYEPMAIKVMRQIGEEAHERWPIDRVAVVHRLGRVDIGETSVAIVVASAHRKVAFEACHHLIDRLKQIVPIWKREYFEDGAVWVDPQLRQ